MKNDEVAVRKDFEYAKLAGMPLIVAAPSTDALDVVEKLAVPDQGRDPQPRTGGQVLPVPL